VEGPLVRYPLGGRRRVGHPVNLPAPPARPG
jgi:hypothetical protein